MIGQRIKARLEDSDMTKPRKPRFGKLPPQYSFVLNPYPDMRVSRCPFGDHKTGQRKLPLLVHIEPMHMIALNYTCRYCSACDLLIAHKHEIEHLLTRLFSQYDPDVIGNEYLIMGTVEKGVWREGLQQTKAVVDMLAHVSDFAEYYEELRVTSAGWYPEGQVPPVMEPPPSEEWVKTKPGMHPRRLSTH
jgi:hypothetical protein